MADEKLTNLELIKHRRSLALRELALASFYPQTHSGIVLQPQARRDADPEESVAKPWKKPWDNDFPPLAASCQGSRVAEQCVAAAVMHDLARFEKFIAHQHIGKCGNVLRAGDPPQWREVHENSVSNAAGSAPKLRMPCRRAPSARARE